MEQKLILEESDSVNRSEESLSESSDLSVNIAVV